MAGSRCIVLVAFLFVCISYATARTLQQEAAAQDQSSDLAVQAPIQLGDGTERIIRAQSVRRRGGAAKAVGRAGLASLRTKSRFRGTLVDLARAIEHDDDLAIDAVNKALMFICEGLAANNSEIASGYAPSQLDTAVTAAQAFSLSSRPSATRKIFLDFDGHTTTGSDWNRAKGRDPIVSQPYDKDGQPNFWSNDELSDILAIWRAVSEDYAAFDVDVTTAEPANLDGNGVRVVISGSSYDWWGAAAGGVAYVGRFLTPNLPAFVFPQQLGPNTAKYIWEAVSHEVGHTLGLLHDGQVATATTAAVSYYSGQGKWAPIMGNSYNKEVTTFDRGEYANTDNSQDDFAVIRSFLAPLPQQYGSDLATATPLNGTVNSATGLATAQAMGIVASEAGDWFSFTAAAGTATVSAAVLAPWGAAIRANLKASLTVYNAAGTPLANIVGTGMGAPTTAVTLPAAGTYYVSITGAGGEGYSSYASRGQFELSVVYTPCAACDSVVNPNPVVPNVEPSPSPSPAPSPSPSPSPSPVPPPPAALKPMRVASMSLSRVWANTQRTSVICMVTVTVRDAAGVNLPGVKVNGEWTITNAGLAPVTVPTSVLASSTSGTVSFRSSSSVSPAAGTSCVFTVAPAAVVLAGYQLDVSNSILLRQLSW